MKEYMQSINTIKDIDILKRYTKEELLERHIKKMGDVNFILVILFLFTIFCFFAGYALGYFRLLS